MINVFEFYHAIAELVYPLQVLIWLLCIHVALRNATIILGWFR